MRRMRMRTPMILITAKSKSPAPLSQLANYLYFIISYLMLEHEQTVLE